MKRVVRADPSQVEAAVRHFLRAFEALDWGSFRLYFAPDATVFFPFAETPRCVEGARSFEPVFEQFFETARMRGDGPPYLQLAPRDLDIRVWDDLALVTFHLERDSRVGRRTLVMERSADHWRIVHLHASNAEEAASSQQKADDRGESL